MFELLALFSALRGPPIPGDDDPWFAIDLQTGQSCFRDLNGTTTITTVPEPGTLMLLALAYWHGWAIVASPEWPTKVESISGVRSASCGLSS